MSAIGQITVSSACMAVCARVCEWVSSSNVFHKRVI